MGSRGNSSTSEDGSSRPCIGGAKSAPEPDGPLRTHGDTHRIAGGVLQRRLKCTILSSWAPSCSRLLFAAGLVRLMQVLGQVTRPTRQELATIRGTMDTPVPAAHSRYANIRDGGHTNFGRPACGALPILTRLAHELLSCKLARVVAPPAQPRGLKSRRRRPTSVIGGKADRRGLVSMSANDPKLTSVPQIDQARSGAPASGAP